MKHKESHGVLEVLKTSNGILQFLSSDWLTSNGI